MQNSTENFNPVSEVQGLFISDQEDRLLFLKDNSKGLEIRRRDEQRLKRAKEIVEKGQNLNPEELNMLAFIFQHGYTADEYRQALTLSTKAVAAGFPIQHSLIPQATDRLMIQEQLDNGIPLHQLKQKFGTQTRFDELGRPFIPPLDGTATEEELKKFNIGVQDELSNTE